MSHQHKLRGKRGQCRCGHPWSQHIGKYGDEFVICAGHKCKCAYQEITVSVRRVYGVRKQALAARCKHVKSEAFYLRMAVDNELAKRNPPVAEPAPPAKENGK